MTFENEQNGDAEILQLLKAINDAWLNGRFEVLEAIFHDDLVIVHPGFQGRVRGKRACIESYRDFTSHAAIREYRESDYEIDNWVNTAVASYRFEIDYTMNDTDLHDVGRDLFVFVRDEGVWRAVWRTIIS